MFKFLQRIQSASSNTVWLSHHIPKTAGTSLRVSYEKAYGRNNVYKLYEPDQVKQADDGNLVNIPENMHVIHGHFKPHPQQQYYDKDIRRIVWIRDPVMRAWSLMRHIVSVQKHRTEYAILFDEFGSKLTLPDEDVFHFFLTHPVLKKLNRPYQNYFSKIPLNQFDFVGVAENYKEDINRLSSLMGVKLSYEEKNIRKSKSIINRGEFKNLLNLEYNVIKDYYI